jgi:hypothetical protein
MNDWAGPAEPARAAQPTRLDRRKVDPEDTAGYRSDDRRRARHRRREHPGGDRSGRRRLRLLLQPLRHQPELFDAAVAEVLKEHGRLLDRGSVGSRTPRRSSPSVSAPAPAPPTTTPPSRNSGTRRSELPARVGRARSAGPARRRARRRRRPLRRRHPVPGVVTTTGCLVAYLHVRLHAPDRPGHETADEFAEHTLRMMAMSPAGAHDGSHRPLPWAPAAAPAQ